MFNAYASDSIVPDLRQHDVAVVPYFLSDTTIHCLLAEAERLPWRPAAEVVDNKYEEQDYWVLDKVPTQSTYTRVARALENEINDVFSREHPAPTPGPIRFNNLRVQYYPKGSQGIEPHRDRAWCRYLVALLVLRSGGSLCMCEDERRAVTMPIKSNPGDLILMRGFGLWGEEKRPWHFVPPLEESRTTFGLRCVP